MFRALALSFLLATPVLAADAGRPVRVAVLYFDVLSADPDLAAFSKGLAAMMITDLAASSLQVVERDRLESLLAELKLGESRFADKSKFPKVGSLLGADVLVTGTLLRAGKVSTIELRVYSVATSQVVHTQRVQLQNGDVLEAEQQAVDGVLKHLDRLQATSTPTMVGGTATPRAPLPFSTAVKYSQALDAKDRKDPAAASKLLKEVVAEQPQFKLAQLDLLSLTN